MKLLVLGSEGMLGHKVLQTLAARFPGTTGTIRGTLDGPFYRAIPLFGEHPVVENVDALDFEALRVTLASRAPDVIVNCVGVIKQRDEAHVAVPTVALNALLPHLLAQWAGEWGGRVIHFSTDCVFSGRRGRYTEEDLSDAEDLYGKAKALGEVTAPNAITLRTSIIGRELAHFRSLLEWFLAQRGATIRGYRRVIYAGVTTNYLAGVVAELIARHPRLSGLYQVTSEPISKHDLLCQLRDAYGVPVTIVPEEETVSDRSMIGDRFRAATGIVTPPWPALVAQLVADPTPYPDWRRGD